MIKSITFNEGGKGYIYKKVQEPHKPKRHNSREEMVYDKHPERFGQDMEAYEKKLAEYKKDPDAYVLPCAKNLVGRTFTFEPGKINILFGPNASGKTTILRSIAGEAMCFDGFTSPLTLDQLSFYGLGDSDTMKDILNTQANMKKNSSDVDWDGAPVYYHNFAERQKNGRTCGSLVGSVLDNIMEETAFVFESGSKSSGQLEKIIMNRVLNSAAGQYKMHDIIDTNQKIQTSQSMGGMNSYYRGLYDSQREYFSKKPMYDVESTVTLLLDEVDKSLDITAQLMLYQKALPLLVEKFGTQVILVSHNPLVLSSLIKGNPLYNIISVDDKYTEEITKQLSGVHYE